MKPTKQELLAKIAKLEGDVAQKRSPGMLPARGNLTAQLTIEQAAQRLNRHPSTLAAWRKRNYGPPFRRIGLKIEYSEKRLEEWLEAQEEIPTGSAPEAGNLALPVQGKGSRILRTNRFAGYRGPRERGDRLARARAAKAEKMRMFLEENQSRLKLKEEAN